MRSQPTAIMHASAVARSRITVTAARVRRPGRATTKIRVTSPPNWVGRKFVVKVPIRYARTAFRGVESIPAASRKMCQRRPPTTNEAKRARTASANQPQLPPERRLRSRPKSICVATAASRPALTTARTQNEPASLRRRFRRSTIAPRAGADRDVGSGAGETPTSGVRREVRRASRLDSDRLICLAAETSTRGSSISRCRSRQAGDRRPRRSQAGDSVPSRPWGLAGRGAAARSAGIGVAERRLPPPARGAHRKSS